MSHKQEPENETAAIVQAQSNLCGTQEINTQLCQETSSALVQNFSVVKLEKCNNPDTLKESDQLSNLQEHQTTNKPPILQQQEHANSSVSQVSMICSLVLSDGVSQEENFSSEKSSPQLRQSTKIAGRISANNSPHRESTSPSKKLRYSTQQSKPESLFEKKSARFRFVKDWEDKRIQKTAIFMSIFNNLTETMSKMIKESNEFIENLLLFFHDSQVQFQGFAKAPKCQLQEAFGYRPSLTNVSYSSMNLALRQVRDNDKIRCDNYAGLSKFIESNITNGLLLKDKVNFESSSESFSSIVKEKQAKIQKLEKAAANAFWEYSELFKVAVQQQAKPTKERPLDIYYQEIVFMHEASQLLEQVRAFGVAVVRFVRQLSSLQQQRVENISRCLHQYLEKRKETLQLETESSEIIEISNAVRDLEGSWNVSVESLLLPEHANYIRKCYERISEVDGDLLEQFALDFQIMPFEGENFVLLGEFEGQERIKKHKDNWVPVIISFTLDKYILVSSRTPSTQQLLGSMKNSTQSIGNTPSPPDFSCLSPQPCFLPSSHSASSTTSQDQPLPTLSINFQSSTSSNSTQLPNMQPSNTDQLTQSNSQPNSIEFPSTTIPTSSSPSASSPPILQPKNISLNPSQSPSQPSSQTYPPHQHFLINKPSSAIYLPESKTTFDSTSMLLTIKQAQKKLFWTSHKTHNLKFTNPSDCANILALIYSNQTPNPPDQQQEQSQSPKKSPTQQSFQTNTHPESQQ